MSNEPTANKVTALDPKWYNTLSIGYFVDLFNNHKLCTVIKAGNVVGVFKEEK